MNISFDFTWCKKWQTEFNIPKGYLIIKPEEIYRKNLGVYLNKLNEYQEKKGELKTQCAKHEYHYKQRTIDQNTLYWALRAIQANEMNGGRKGPKMITPEQLHEDYLTEYGERETVKTQRKNLSRYRNKGRVEFVIIDQQKLTLKQFFAREDVPAHTLIGIQRIIGTNELNTKKMAAVIEQVFTEIWESGVNESGDIHRYWVEWRDELNKEKIILNDTKMTKAEYRAKNPMCEGCGTEPAVQIAHIRAKGMGGKEEEEKDHPLNWLHLCNRCHNVIIHGNGWNEFKRIFPHLDYKITQAFENTPETHENEQQGVLFSEQDMEKVESQVCPECRGIVKRGEDCKCGGIGFF